MNNWIDACVDLFKPQQTGGKVTQRTAAKSLLLLKKAVQLMISLHVPMMPLISIRLTMTANASWLAAHCCQWIKGSSADRYIHDHPLPQ